MAIVNPLPYNIQDGQAVDAVPIMANLNQIVNNVNANAAPVAGNAAQTFAVASATASGQAINLGQANSLYAPVSGNAAQTFAVASATASGQAINLGQANGLYAPVSGNAAQTFAVANATATNQAVNLGQANSLYAPVSGNAAQTFAVANATASNQAVALGQFSPRPFYSSANTTITNIAANSTVTLLSIAVTMPSFSKTGGFRVFVFGQIMIWPNGGSASQQPLTFSLNDGTNNFVIGFTNAGSTPYNGCMVVGRTGKIYSLSQSLTFYLTASAGGSSVTVPVNVPGFSLFVEEA